MHHLSSTILLLSLLTRFDSLLSPRVTSLFSVPGALIDLMNERLTNCC